MKKASTQRRRPFACDPATLADPTQGLALARALWGRGQREMSLDIYDQLAQAHPNQAVVILAEAFDRLLTIVPRTRYTLYQSRFFDFAITPGDKVLDMGSGHMPFPLATHLADISLSGGNTGRAGSPFRHVDGKPAYEVRVEDTDFADKQFDFVYCSHVLEHADDPAAACRELMRIARRGYIETPTKGKDALMGSARISNHRWHVELLDRTLIFTEYEERDLAGFGVDILMNMHTQPQTDREKAFSALVWLRADQCNTMLAWDGGFDFQVRRPSVTVQVPQNFETNSSRTGKVEIPASGSATDSTAASEPGAVSAQPAGRSLRLMQVHSFYPDYLHYFYYRRPDIAHASYAEQTQALRLDGFSAVHMLAEHLDPLGYETQLVVANNLTAQHTWAFEQRLDFQGSRPSLQDILQAQVESFAPDVLYISDPITFDSHFVRKLSRRPQLVLGWRAANIPESWDPTEFDVILSCLTGLRAKALEMGARDVAHFHPGFPDALFQVVRNEQPVHDVVFCGQVNANQYRNRNARLHLLAEACAQGRFGLRMNLSGHLEATTPLTRALNTGSCFGLDMYRALRSGRVVFDVRGDIGLVGPGGKAQDLAGRQTANMRIFEATGVGAFLLTEHFDNVEEFFRPGIEIETYANDAELLDKIAYYLKHEDRRMEIAAKGLERCRNQHSMERRIRDFDRLVRERLSPAPDRASTAARQEPATPEISLQPKGSPTRRAALLTEKLTRLAALGSLPRAQAAEVVQSAMPLIKELIQANAFRSALSLICAAKQFSSPMHGLDLLRASAFLGLNDVPSTREALKEELRYFPNNAEAQRLLNNLPDQAAAPESNLPPEFSHLVDTVRPYTMLSTTRLRSLYDLAISVCREDIPGNLVECGVAAGGSSALLAWVIKRHSVRPRKLFCFDTFEGMPAPSEADKHAHLAANETGWGEGTCAAPMQSLLDICQKLDISDIIQPVKGLFKDTLPVTSPQIGDIALLHMDGDWFESTRDILENLYSQVVPQGRIQVDDYGHWEGCKKAMHEFEPKTGTRFNLHRIDNTGVWFKKPDSFTDATMSRFLNLGCGQRHHPAWTNLDFNSSSPDVIAYDLGKGLPFESNSYDVVYHSHLLEHFPKYYASLFLKDCYRILDIGGIIRVVIPDLERIARIYLDLMEKSLNGDTEAQNRYEWIMLELFDQMTRNTPGGHMLEYWKKNPMPAENFVIERMGSEAIASIERIRSTPDNSNSSPRSVPSPDPLKIGQFRLAGEVHQWMYDRYSLCKLLQEVGFEDIRVCRANESRIPDFNSYLLDIEADGSIRKPDSLFMEARKPGTRLQT